MPLCDLPLGDCDPEVVLLSVQGKIREGLAVTIRGANFPERAVEPEILAGERRAVLVHIAPDQRSFCKLPRRARFCACATPRVRRARSASPTQEPRSNRSPRNVEMSYEWVLTKAERAGAIAYEKNDPAPAGAHLDFPHCPIDVPWEADVLFVDREPLANWGHACRYLLVNCKTNEVLSIEARFPPFRPDQAHCCRVFYRAPSLPPGVCP
jgi:hypothetical protein